MTEIEKIQSNSSVIVMLNGDLMQFVFDENMQMTKVIEPNNSENLALMTAMLADALEAGAK